MKKFISPKINLTKVNINWDLSKSFERCSRVELELARGMKTQSMQKTIRGYFGSDGTFVCGHQNQFCLGVGEVYPLDVCDVNQLLSFCYDFKLSKNSLPLKKLQHDFDSIDAIFRSNFLYLTLTFSLQYSPIVPFQSIIYFGEYLYEQLDCKNLNLYVDNNWSRSYIDFLRPYLYRLDMDIILFFYNEKKNIGYNAGLTRYNGEVIFLPLSYFQHPKFDYVMKLFIPHRRPLWYGFESINAASMVYLTDEVGLSLTNNGKNICVLSDFDAHIDAVEIEHFRGCELKWILLDDGGEMRNMQYQKALRVMERFDKADIALSVMIFDNVVWEPESCSPEVSISIPVQRGKYSRASIFPKDDFVRLAAKLGCQIPDRLKYDRYGLIDMTAVESDTAPLVEKFLAPNEVTLVEEFARVPVGSVSRQIAMSRDALWGDRHTVNQKFKPLVIISAGKQKKYSGLPHVAVGHFLKFSGENAMTNFRSLLEKVRPNVIVFDTEWLFESDAAKNAKAAIIHCREAGIGIVVVYNYDVNNGVLPKWLCADADLRFRLMPLPKRRNAFIWERVDSDAPEFFKINYNSGQVVVSDASEVELRSIEGRDTENNTITPIYVSGCQGEGNEIG